MKKEELDLSKAHVDQFKKSESKSYSGEKLALTTAGWATVTQDGTIVEVLDAFPASQNDIFQDFIDRNELPFEKQLTEEKILNFKEIGLNADNTFDDISDKKGELIISSGFIPFSTDFLNVTGLENNTGTGISRYGDWIEGQTSRISATVSTQGGIAPFSYNWKIIYANADGIFEFQPPKTEPSISLTMRDLESNLNGLSFNGCKLICEVEDGNEDTQVMIIKIKYFA